MVNVRSVARLLTPALIWKAANSLRRPPSVYASFAAAAAASADSYANSDLTRITLQKTLIARDKGLPDIDWKNGAGLYTGLAYAAALLPGRPLRILDFGGSFGFHALVCAKTFPDINLKWAVVESEDVVASSPIVESDWLRFFVSLDEAVNWLGGVDLMHSSGTVQYLPDPDEAMHNLINLGATVMLWQRMMFAKGRRTHVVQSLALSGDHNGLGEFLPAGFTDHHVRFPCTYITEEELTSACTERYRLAIRVPPVDHFWDRGLASFGTVLLFVQRDASAQGG